MPDDDDDFATGGAEAQVEVEIARLNQRSFVAQFDSRDDCESCGFEMTEGSQLVYVDDAPQHLQCAIADLRQAT